METWFIFNEFIFQKGETFRIQINTVKFQQIRLLVWLIMHTLNVVGGKLLLGASICTSSAFSCTQLFVILGSFSRKQMSQTSSSSQFWNPYLKWVMWRESNFSHRNLWDSKIYYLMNLITSTAMLVHSQRHTVMNQLCGLF